MITAAGNRVLMGLVSIQSWSMGALLVLLTVPAGVSADGRAVFRDFSLDVGERMVGSEYRRVTVLSLERCADLCYRQTLCRAFSYHRLSGGCNLNARILRTRRHRAYVTGIKIGGSRAPEPAQRRPAPAAHAVAAAGAQRASGALETGHLGRMRIEYGVTRPGNGYQALYRDHADDCARECDRRSSCWSFRYRPRTRACTLFAQLVAPRPLPGVVSGAKQPPADGTTDGVASVYERDGFVVYKDLAVYGSDYRHTRAFDADRCIDECRSDPSCRAFSYHPSDSLCYLKSVPTTRSYRKGVVSGVRQ